MANQYSKLTKENILRKMNRKSNPVSSVTQLAREFGVNTEYTRHLDWYGREGKTDSAPPANFRNKVKGLIGAREYQKLAKRHRAVAR